MKNLDFLDGDYIRISGAESTTANKKVKVSVVKTGEPEGFAMLDEDGLLPAGRLPGIPDGNLPVDMSRFFVGELYPFLVVRPEFIWANGSVLANVTETCPRLKDWLLDAGTYGGAFLRKTPAEWNAEWNAVAAKDKLGIGLCGKYVYDEGADTIRVPDLRGAYLESAGYDSFNAGGVHGDIIRNITGSIQSIAGGVPEPLSLADNWRNTGAMWADMVETYSVGGNTSISGAGTSRFNFNAASAPGVQTGNANKPRALAVKICIYVGRRVGE